MESIYNERHSGGGGGEAIPHCFCRENIYNFQRIIITCQRFIPKTNMSPKEHERNVENECKKWIWWGKFRERWWAWSKDGDMTRKIQQSRTR